MNTLTKDKFKKHYLRKLKSLSSKTAQESSTWDKYHALGILTKEYLGEYWAKTNEIYHNGKKKQVYYFSMEFLTGRFLINNLKNLGIYDVCKEALMDLDIELDEIAKIEKDQGLGNGGLGRLAACFLDSMSSLAIPGHGCGIRYNYGLFEQKIINGYQVEYPDRWLSNRNVWEVKKPDKAVFVKLGGRVKTDYVNDRLTFEHVDYELVKAVPYDTPIVGYKNNTINTLRLWSAESVQDDFDYSKFSRGEYIRAFERKHSAESISQVLYPNDSYDEGKMLRLKQEYFFVSAGIQSILRSYLKSGQAIEDFGDNIAVHINDTHPALLVPELMRLFVDEHDLTWETAWAITQKTLAYTNHTIMQEALEKWPVDMIRGLLPRIYMIIEEINHRFLFELRNAHKYSDEQKISEMSIIDNGVVRMAHLAIVGSHSTNGVAKLHTEILKKQELKDFYNIYPYKFNNKTNGITHRRWLMYSNPKLTSLIENTIGPEFIKNPLQLRSLLAYRHDSSFQEQIEKVKFDNKLRLAKYIKDHNNIVIDPHSIFDVQAKRLHEYKRQILNILHVMHLYNELKENPNLDVAPRTFIFAAKAAPSYHTAKQTIKLINTVANKINNDPLIRNKLKVVFLENYGVSLAEILIPATEVSEQISTASKEASGTGNMKFMMNGAVTIATLDGANVEIEKEVGKDNIVIFGLKEEEVYKLYEDRSYNSTRVYEKNIRIKRVIDQLINGYFDVSEDEFRIIHDGLMKYNDEYFVLEDFDSYVSAHQRILKYYSDAKRWNEMAITNIACSGVFSSDNTINEYASSIWDVQRVPVDYLIDY